MDPRIAARRRRVQETRARRSLRRLLWLLGTAAVIAGGLWLIRSPLFSVSEIRIQGAVQAPVEESLARSGTVEGVPMIDVDLEAAEEAIESDPWVVDATVAREWPGSLVVSVSERTAVAVARTAAGPTVVAEDGVAVSDVVDPELPILDVPEFAPQALDDLREVRGALAFLAALPDPLKIGTVVRFSTDGMEASVMGYAVRLGSPTDGPAKAATLTAVLETGPEAGSIITVMAPDRPAVLPPGSSEDAVEGGSPDDEVRDD